MTRICIFLLISISLAVLMSYFSLFFFSVNDIPVGDHWRWIRGLLIPYSEGRISLWQFLSGEFNLFSHSHILTLAVVLGSYTFFDLRYDIEAYVGLASAVILAVFLGYQFYRKSGLDSANPLLYVGILAIVATLFNPHNMTTWSILLFEYLYLLGAVLFMYWYDRVVSQGTGRYIFFLLLPVYIFVGDAMGISALLSCVVCTVLFSLRKHWHYLVVIFLVIAVCIPLARWLIPDMHPHHRFTMSMSMEYMIGHPLQVAQSILNAYSLGLLSPALTKQLSPNNWFALQQSIGFLMLLVQLGAVGAFIKYRKELPSQFPLLLIIFSAISAVGIVQSRLVIFGPIDGPNFALGNRYARLFQVGLVGAFWIYFEVWGSSRQYALRPLLKTVTCFMLGLVIASATITHSGRWKKVDHTRNYVERAVVVTKLYAQDPEVDIGELQPRCKKGFCKDSIAFLKKNQLSIFRSGHKLNSSD